MTTRVARALDVVAECREREAELEALCVDLPANADGSWNAKDHLAHLTWWRFRSARLLDAARTGDEPPTSVEDDPQNAAIYAETRDRPAADIKANARTSWSDLRRAIEACTEDDLARPHPHAAGHEVWEMVPGVGGHLGTHLMFWYLDHDDEQRAESAARWAYGLESRSFARAEQRADAAYNLACFYSRVGRVAEALPLLRASLEAKPELVAYARKDPDLERVREDPRAAELWAAR